MTDSIETKQAKQIDHVIPQALLDHVIATYEKPAELIGQNGLLKQLIKAVIEAALHAEMAEHLGHDRHGAVGNSSGNVRNAHSAKTITGELGELGELGEVAIAVPRDREARFAPQPIGKHQRRFPDMDERILSLYARHEYPRDGRAFAGDVRGRGVAHPDLGHWIGSTRSTIWTA